MSKTPSSPQRLVEADANVREAQKVWEAFYARYSGHSEPRPEHLVRDVAYAQAQYLITVFLSPFLSTGIEQGDCEDITDLQETIATMLVSCLGKDPDLIRWYCEALTRNHLHEWRIFTEDRVCHDYHSRLWWCLHRLPYAQYLHTAHWKSRRAVMLEKAHHRCQVCNTAGRLNVHHRTYERRGQEREEDLVVLCLSCHKLFHAHGKLAVPPED